MAGNSNSGRKGYREELMTRKLCDLAPKILVSLLENHESGKCILTNDELIKICLPISTKQIADRVEHEVMITATPELISLAQERLKRLDKSSQGVIEYHPITESD